MKLTIPTKTKPDKKRRVCVYISKTSATKLKKLSKTSGTSMSEIVDNAIKDCLE